MEHKFTLSPTNSDCSVLIAIAFLQDTAASDIFQPDGLPYREVTSLTHITCLAHISLFSFKNSWRKHRGLYTLKPKIHANNS